MITSIKRIIKIAKYANIPSSPFGNFFKAKNSVARIGIIIGKIISQLPSEVEIEDSDAANLT